MQELLKFFNARRSAYHTAPKLIEDVIYTPYAYEPQAVTSDSSRQTVRGVAATGDLLGVPDLVNDQKTKKKSKFDTSAKECEIFVFPYGTVVIWGMTEAQERRFLSSM